MTVSDLELARAISESAQKIGKTSRVHVKIDTGMGRLGTLPDKSIGLIESIKGMPNIALACIYTHCATAAERSISGAESQIQIFARLMSELQQKGIDYGIAHAANSASILRMPEAHFDMVRPGTLLYGQYPSQYVPHSLDLKPTWKLKARICEVKELPATAPIGYGGEFVTKRPTRTAVIPVGWSDGFTLAPEGPIYRQSLLKFALKKMKRRPFVEIRDNKAPVLGRVAMQMIVIDVTDVPGAQVGDEVIIPAMRIPTSALVPRVYIN